VSDEIVPDKNLGAAPQPLRGAERNTPAPPRGAFHLRVDLGGRPQHTPGVPLGIGAMEPPYCAASLVARPAIDYTVALFFALQ
jgi:hypothetical protein